MEDFLHAHSNLLVFIFSSQCLTLNLYLDLMLNPWFEMVKMKLLSPRLSVPAKRIRSKLQLMLHNQPKVEDLGNGKGEAQ